MRAFRRLRGKLGDDDARPVYILTERGVGYRMAPPPHRVRPGARPQDRRAASGVVRVAEPQARAARFRRAGV
ncbi:MAG: helix-turn-helix domain-containing protein [Acidobacteria bacterium]|nr:helix-turn-helix domain-containing protein [Acidobacteriota bacterium]